MKKNIFTKTFFILIILISLLIGIIFSSIEIGNHAKLDSTFSGKYVATVKVEKNKEDDTPKEEYAKEAADILEKRLNPMGINDISVEVAGYNYLKVHGSKSNFTDEAEFKSEIQKTGSIFLLVDNKNGGKKDISISGTREKDFAKNTLSDYIKSAKAGTYSAGGAKNPIIDFEVDGSKWEFPTSEDGQPSSLNIEMLSDPDAFFESVRSMYKTIDNSDSRLKSKAYYDRVLNPIKDLVSKEKNSVFAKAIEDLFYGTYKENGVKKPGISLIDANGDLAFSDYRDFDNMLFSTWEFSNVTSKYVYNSNSSSDEFTESGGAYNLQITNAKDGKSIGFIEEVFSELINKIYIGWYNESNKVLIGQVQKDFNTKVANQVIFNGSIFDGAQNGSMYPQTGFIDGSAMKLFVESFSKSRVGATIFQASGKGYIFNVDSVENVEALINDTFFIVLTIALIVLVVLFMIYILFSYRILGAVILMSVLAVMFATIAISTSWLGLTFGIETLIALFIIFAINCQLSISLVDAMKKSVYNLKRDFKSSLVLSIKENVGIIVDTLVALLIPSFCLFWLSTAALKTFSILITFGVVFSLIGQLVVLFVLFRLIISTQIFTKLPFLFAINISGNSNREMIYLYQIEQLGKKIEKAEKASNFDKARLLTEKLNIQKEKLNNYYISQQEKVSSQESKYIVHLKKQKGILENKLIKIKNDKRKLKLELKIVDIDKTLEQMGVEVEINSNVVVETFDRYELSRFKSRSGFIAKILFIGLIAISTLSVGLGLGIGINYDSTMGGRVEYTVYGQNVRSGIDAVEDISTEKDVDASLKNLAKEINDKSGNHEDELLNAQLYAEFLLTGFSKYSKELINYANVPNVSLNNVSFEVAYGDDYQYSTSEPELKAWVQIKAKNISSKQSNKLKSVLYKLGIDENPENSPEYGMVSKRIFSKTTTNTIVKTAIAFGVSLLVLGLYILIRYGWTYFVALAMGSVLLVGLIIVIVIGSHLLVGSTLVISLWALFLLFITFSLTYFGKIKEKLSTKDNKSMNEYFNTEIDVLMSLRNFRKGLKKDVQELKVQRRIELKERKLKFKTTKSKERKLNLNKEEVKTNIVLWTSENKEANKETKLKFKTAINELKATKKTEYKLMKKEGNEKIIVASKENNYVLSVVLGVFKENLNKFIFILGCYAITFIIFMIFIPTIFSMGMTLLIGSILGWIIISFICLPMWLTIEQVRLRKNLTRKKFISELKVSNEEQIIEGIND